LPLAEASSRCPDCDLVFDIEYDYELARARIAEIAPAERPFNLWRFEELLPIVDGRAKARVGQFSGQTPLIPADRLGAELGLRNLYLKDDSTNRPSLSYKDRVVAMAVARALELGKDEIGCVSTGNVGTATASLAAKAGLRPYVFYPANLERAKARGCRALGAQVCQLDGNYDEANRACRELAQASGIEFANITLRPFYAEGAKTLAFEVVEQLDWRSPDHIVMPAAGGTLSSRVHKGLNELEAVGLAETAGTKLHIGQPTGCSPIATAISENSEEIVPQVPETLAHSLAIGAPGDGPLVVDAVRSRGGSAAAAADGEIITAMELLAATEGVLTEPAGGTTLAATMKLAQQGVLRPDDTVVVVISGNGLKTLNEQPVRPWPEGVPCNAATMEEVVMDFRHDGVVAPN
jgi:threonine synthase